jgi:DNA repair exonuclease SbcCD nuclease subunit
MEFKFVHAADLHLDSPLRASSAGPLEQTFAEATFVAFRRIIDLCIAEKAEFLLLAGDLFEYRDRSIRARLALHRELARLQSAGIGAFIVHGNHDPLSANLATVQLPDSVKVFGPAWEEVVVRREGRIICRIQGISYPQERVTEDLTPLFSRQGPELTIGLLHANVGASAGHANYAPCNLADLAARGLDYWALGHVHTRAEHPLDGGGVAVYPGNPQGRHIAEPGERGCVVVTVCEGKTSRRFCSVDSVRWCRIGVDIGALTSWNALLQEVEAAIGLQCGKGPDAWAVQLVIAGAGALHGELSRPGALGELAEHVAPLALKRSPPVLLDCVDETRPELDLRAAAGPGSIGETIASLARAAQLGGTGWNELCADESLSKLALSLSRAGIRRVPERTLLDRAMVRALELLWAEAEG